MIHRQPAYYAHFRCLGGSCPDTCCQDWDIVLDEKTIADYRAAPPPLSARLKASLTTDQDGDTCFRLDEHGRCTMLTEDGLCAIQKEWGEAHLCGHCAAYPRFIEEFGCLTESSLALSCPEAARLLLESPTFQIVEENSGQPDPPFPDIPPQLLTGLEISRKKVLDGMTQDGYTVWERMQGMLDLAYELQKAVDRQDFSALDEGNLSLRPLSPTEQGKTFAQSLCRFFSSLEPLRPSWPQSLDHCLQVLDGMTGEEYQGLCRQFEFQVPQWQRHLTSLASYLIFRHWHKTVNDDQLYGRAAFVSCSVILLYHLFLVQWVEHQSLSQAEEIVVCSAFSREVEHMEENLDLAIDTCAALPPASIHFPQS